MKYLANILSGFSPEQCKPSNIEEGIPYIKVDNLNYNHPNIDLPEGYVSEKFIVSKNKSLLFPKRGAAIALNKVSLVEIPFSMDTNLMGLKLTNDKLSIKYMYYILKCISLISIADTSTIPQINNKHIDPMILPLPSINEQLGIVTHIETESARLDTIIDKFKKQIELFKEYRTTLISEVVTGKIDVRGEVAV